MKINNKSIGVLFLFYSLLLSSCTDALEQFPKDKLSDMTFWKETTDLEVYVNTFYQSLPAARDNSIADGWDNQVPKSRNTELWGEGIIPSSGGGWSSADWSNIRACNYFMSRHQTVADEHSQYVAEVRFFRAMFYFDKLCQFGDVPFYNKDLGVEDVAELYKPRDSRTLVADSILADLDYAIQILPAKQSAVNGRIHKDVASALASRVSLFEGTWRKYRGDNTGLKYLEKSVKYAEQVMNGGYSIWKGAGDPYLNYYKLFIEEDLANNSEVIFAKVYDRELNLKQGTTRTLDNTSTGLSYDFSSSYLCLDGKPIAISSLYEGSDSLRQEMTNRDPRMQQTIDSPNQVYTSEDDGGAPLFNFLPLQRAITSYQLVKFHSPYMRDFDALNSTIDYPIYRYAEVLLNYAEAKAELGILTNSDLDISINKIRDRVGMPDMTLENINFEDVNVYNCGYEISPLIREIRRERRIELIAEGFRGNDIKRWKAGALLENPKAFLGLKINPEMRDRYDALNGEGTYTRETTEAPNYLLISYQGIAPLKWFDRLYLSPLPKDQLKLNPKLKQNPGWE